MMCVSRVSAIVPTPIRASPPDEYVYEEERDCKHFLFIVDPHVASFPG